MVLHSFRGKMMTIEFKVVPNRCDCHPETCACNPWAIVDNNGKKYSSSYLQEDAQALVDLLNKGNIQDGN